MKKKFVTVFFVFICSTLICQFCFAKSIKPDIEFEVTQENDEEINETFEEFEFPGETKIIKNVIKADIGTAGSCFLFEGFSLIPTNITRIPLSWEMALADYCAIQLEIECLSYFIMPSAMGISGGASIYPLGKAPYDLYISLRAGGAFGLFYAFTAQADLGWQFILKSDFAISVGASFAYYFSTVSNQFYIPSVSFSVGWGF